MAQDSKQNPQAPTIRAVVGKAVEAARTNLVEMLREYVPLAVAAQAAREAANTVAQSLPVHLLALNYSRLVTAILEQIPEAKGSRAILSKQIAAQYSFIEAALGSKLFESRFSKLKTIALYLPEVLAFWATDGNYGKEPYGALDKAYASAQTAKRAQNPANLERIRKAAVAALERFGSEGERKMFAAECAKLAATPAPVAAPAPQVVTA